MGTRSGIRCTICLFLHIGGLHPHMGRSAHPRGRGGTFTTLFSVKGSTFFCFLRVKASNFVLFVVKVGNNDVCFSFQCPLRVGRSTGHTCTPNPIAPQIYVKMSICGTENLHLWCKMCQNPLLSSNTSPFRTFISAFVSAS